MKHFKSRKNRLIAVGLAVALVITSLAIGLSGTFAAKPDKQVRLVQPNSNPVLAHGAVFEFNTSGVNAVSLVDTALGTASISNPAKSNARTTLNLNGSKTAGVAAVMRGSAIGTVGVISFQVVDPSNIAGYNLPNGGNGYIKDPRPGTPLSQSELGIKYYKIGAPATPTGAAETNSNTLTYVLDNSLASKVTWESLNWEVIDASLKPVGRGATILLGTFTDRWGVKQTIAYLFGVGEVPNDSFMSDLLDAINKGKEVLLDYANNPVKYKDYPGIVNKMADLAQAVAAGEGVLDNSNSTEADHKNAAKSIWDAIDAIHPGGGSSGGDGTLIPGPGQPPNSWYRPVGQPPHVWEVLNKDKNSKYPPEYVYNPGNAPGDGNDKPAYGPKNGAYWVLHPDYPNIYLPLDSNGIPKNMPAIWGGPDGEWDGGDDEAAVLGSDGLYYVDLGQNVFRKVNKTNPNPGQFGTNKPIGGGPNGTPGNTDDLKANIFLNENDGKYYAGPFIDDDGDEYYIGDKRPRQGGLNTKGQGTGNMTHGNPIDSTDQIYYMDDDGNMVTTKPGSGNGNLIPGPGQPPNSWYRPVGQPPHVWEVLNKDKNSKYPPEYVYNPGDTPGDGSDTPAYGPKNGAYWVLHPDYPNIYLPLDSNGVPENMPAVWGGPNGEWGGGDDEPAVFGSDGLYYVDLGQNVFRKVNKTSPNPGQFGTNKPIGGGPNGTPGNTDDLKANIFLNENDGKYYAGPFVDDNGDEYYIGDKRPRQGGLNTKGQGTGNMTHGNPIDSTDQIYYMDSDGNMVTTKPGGGGSGGNGNLIPGTGQPPNSWYRPVGRPPHIYEVLDRDKNSKYPPEYVYNQNNTPGDGRDKPAYIKDGAYWVEKPSYPNIYVTVDNITGDLKDEPAIWGGPDGLWTGSDNKPAIFGSDGFYYVDLGQNVFQKVNKTNPNAGQTTGNPLVGGGPDYDPVTAPVTPIYKHTDGKYFVGPLNPGPNEYYYGDSKGSNGNSLLDSTSTIRHWTDDTYYLQGGVMVTQPSINVPTPKPDGTGAVNATTISGSKLGDNSDWITIAARQVGGQWYLLIVRKNNLPCAYNCNYNPKGNQFNYSISNVKSSLENWYNGCSLSTGSLAGLKSYAVTSNAPSKQGPQGILYDSRGISDPVPASNAYSYPFALSFQEYASYLSLKYLPSSGISDQPSPAIAASNWNKITADRSWSRSPRKTTGDASGLWIVGKIGDDLTSNNGIRPAMWVSINVLS